GGSLARVAVALDQPITARTFFLDNPNRFVIDMPGAAWSVNGRQAGSGQGAGVVSGYRFAMRPDGAARLVLDLTASTTLVRQTIRAHGAPALSSALATAATPVLLHPEPVRLETTARRNLPRKTVIIDPGHGGHDPGAIGATGVREKDV